ncbi:MAG: oligosaccharide flippase family protein [Bryobacteraceae bacterium]
MTPATQTRGFSDRLSALLRGHSIREMAALYSVHIASYVLPLLTVTYVARVLGPREWGLLSFFHSFGLYASLAVEYGFNFSATREVARNRDDRHARSATLGDVQAAKLLLSVLLALALIPAYFALPLFSENPRMFAAAVLYALAQGFSMVWYYQGIGELKKLASVEVLSRAAASALTFAVVRSSGDGWWMILLNAVACVVTAAIGLKWALRDTEFRMPSLAGGRRVLREGFSIFLFRGASSLYGAANGFLLGLMAAPQLVGYYGGAERAYRGFLALLHPLTQFLYARVNYTIGRAQESGTGETNRIARQTMLAMIAAGAGLGTVCWAAAPWIIRILLGPGFEPAVPVLRIFALLLAVDSVGTALGIQWMLPLGLDRQYTAIIVSAGLANLILAALLAPRFGHVGMALAVLTAEGIVAAGCFFYLRYRKLDPFRVAESRPVEVGS